jgi:hypothetical protein
MLSLIALSPQPQYQWILHFHTSGVKVLRIEYNRVENIGVIEKKTADILANIDDVKDVAIKHLNEVADKMKHLLEIHIETYWFQRSLTDFSVAKSLLSYPYLDQSSFGLFGLFQPNKT